MNKGVIVVENNVRAASKAVQRRAALALVSAAETAPPLDGAATTLQVLQMCGLVAPTCTCCGGPRPPRTGAHGRCDHCRNHPEPCNTKDVTS